MFVPPVVDLPGHFIEHPSFRIYVETYGDASRPAILLIHGGFQSNQCWRKQVQVLSQQWFVIAFDLPYHGFSSPYGEEEVRLEAGEDFLGKSIHVVVEAFGLREKGFVPVAWSMGGLALNNYLLTYGVEGIRGIVLTGTVLNFVEAMGKYPPEAQTLTVELFSDNPAVRQNGFLKFVNALWHRVPSRDEFLLTFGYNMQSFIRFNLDMPAPEGDVLAVVRQHQLPVLFLQGEYDALVPASIVREMAPTYPDYDLIEYAECGHSAFLEYPERFNQDVHAFVTKVNNTSRT